MKTVPTEIERKSDLCLNFISIVNLQPAKVYNYPRSAGGRAPKCRNFLLVFEVGLGSPRECIAAAIHRPEYGARRKQWRSALPPLEIFPHHSWWFILPFVNENPLNYANDINSQFQFSEWPSSSPDTVYTGASTLLRIAGRRYCHYCRFKKFANG